MSSSRSVDSRTGVGRAVRRRSIADVPRRRWILAAFVGVLAFPFLRLSRAVNKRGFNEKCIRPPGSVEETEFLERCIKCDQCINVCPTNVLQPAGFADARVVALRQSHDKVMRRGGLGGLDHLSFLDRFRPVSDIGPDGVVEQHRILGHQRDRLAQTVNRDRLDILTVDKHLAAIGIVGAYAGSLYGWFAGQERFVYFDFVSTFILLMLVGRRRRMLDYVKANDISRYRSIVAKLGLRH
mgnify:CR=1 FL=1